MAYLKLIFQHSPEKQNKTAYSSIQDSLSENCQ